MDVKRFLPGLVALLLGVGFEGASRAAELVMFESTMCEWCEVWQEEVGETYSKTSEARLATLRRIDIDDGIPANLSSITNVQFTPTFVLVEDGKELGRIVGYPGESFFWQLLSQILNRISVDVGHTCAPETGKPNGEEKTC